MTSTPENPIAASYPVTVLLIDDQPMIGEAVRRMLAEEKDIQFHYCQDPTKAIETANEIQPTVILQDLVMPELDGLMLVKFFRANEPTRRTPLIVLSTKEEPETKAEAFELGANDYMVKLPDKLEVIARIRYHSNGYIAMLQRDEAFQALANELEKAARYVTSLLPPEMNEGPIRSEWQFIPSVQLGGDSFGYHWLDDEHFAIFLLDVTGHGVGSALLSVSAMNVMKSQTLPDVDFHQPAEVLIGMNKAFQMDVHNNMFFTIWYGVFNKTTREMVYATGGHHATVMITGPDDKRDITLLGEAEGLPIGAWDESEYSQVSCTIPENARLYLFSDGVFEIETTEGEYWSNEEFNELIARPPVAGQRDVDRLLEEVRAVHGKETFDDDFSLLELLFE